ncbi:hypothetical protein ACIPWI_00560 [Streptomyces sp. NPDC090046]|uniref:hypothetical protein n=1 Tax=Streptomyces sp. NPDC090046 TaxID=3365928 RepID=UPI003825B96A
MHSTLTEHARCLYEDADADGDGYRPAPGCTSEHAEFYFVEALTFADPDALLTMLRELCPDPADGYLPARIRNLAYRLVLLQRPDEPALLREAARSLSVHAPDGNAIAAALEGRADALDAARRTA